MQLLGFQHFLAFPPNSGRSMPSIYLVGQEGFAAILSFRRGRLSVACFFRLTGKGTLPMFRAISGAVFASPRERVAQPVEQLTFNQ